MSKYWKILIPILFALAILLGLAQRSLNPYLNFQSKVFHFNNSAPSNKSLADYYNLSKELAGQSKASSTVNFLAVGDIMLSRNVAASIKKANNPLLPFSQMAGVLNAVNFSFGNLESPIAPPISSPPLGESAASLSSGREGNGIIGGHSLIFAAPKNNIQGLTKYKFKILNLANNHALDQGLKGLDYTNKYLDENNIKHIGTGNNLDEAWQPAIVEQNGIKIGFVGASYASINDNGKTNNNYVARTEDIDNLKFKIKNLKSQSDFVIVSMHAGVEYTRTPNQAQKDFAYAAIDAGADMVIGSHPHWIQTMEKYNGKYIFYSLGNFIFDQMWSTDTREGMVLKITVSKNVCYPERQQGVEGSLEQSNIRDSSASVGMIGNGSCGDDLQGQRVPAKLESIELIPVIIENYSTPRLANEQETKKILDKIKINTPLLTP